MNVRQAALLLRQGGVVAFPTETVYGLGARFSDEAALRKVFAVKGRPSDNPLIVHIADLAQLKILARSVPPSAFRLAKKFWPGPLTLVLKRSPRVPDLVTAGLDTVAVRMPRHPVALALIRAAGEPLAAPSANRSGRPSATHFAQASAELGGRADGILNGGRARVGLESTVVDLTRTPPALLRPGAVPAEALRRDLPGLFSPSARHAGAARSPGMKHRHYQPACRVVPVNPRAWDAQLRAWQGKGLRLGAISRKKISASKNIVFAKHYRTTAALGRNLYAWFFAAEVRRAQALLVETVEPRGLGLAIMDRLARAGKP